MAKINRFGTVKMPADEGRAHEPSWKWTIRSQVLTKVSPLPMDAVHRLNVGGCLQFSNYKVGGAGSALLVGHGERSVRRSRNDTPDFFGVKLLTSLHTSKAFKI